MDIEYFKKVTLASLTAMLILMLLMAMLPFAVAHSGDKMYAPPLTVAVTIDGIWSAGEWDDAPQYTMIGNRTSYIRAKFNSTHLLVLIDSPWDTTNATLYWHENLWLAFDTAHDGGWSAPLSDDYLFHGQSDTTGGGWGMGWQGNGTAWNYTYLGWDGTIKLVQSGDGSNTTDLQPSPNSATPHKISEMMIPLIFVGYSGSTVGFYAQVDDDSTDPDQYGWLPATAYSEWPPTAGGSPGWPGGWGSAPCPVPSAWGDLVLSTPPVGGTWIPVDKLALLAPYIGLTLMIIVAIAGTATFFKYRKKQ